MIANVESLVTDSLLKWVQDFESRPLMKLSIDNRGLLNRDLQELRGIVEHEICNKIRYVEVTLGTLYVPWETNDPNNTASNLAQFTIIDLRGYSCSLSAAQNKMTFTNQQTKHYVDISFDRLENNSSFLDE